MNKEKNYGLCLLKIWMCLEVVLNHWWEAWYGEQWMIPFMYVLTLAVPCFAIISFMFTSHIFFEGDKSKLLSRLWRLLLPQIAWTVIYSLIYSIIDRKFNGEAFFYQLFFGHSFNSALWFQIDLIVITAVFGIIYILLSKRIATVVIAILGIAATILEYTGINSMLFENFRYETKYPMGRMVEMIPFATVGILLAYSNVLNMLKSKIWLHIVAIIAFCGLTYASFTYIPEIGGYGYAGLYHILTALFGVCFFYLIPINKIPVLRDVLWCIAKYTMGVYFMHNLVATLLVKYLYPHIKFEEKTFYFCLVTFAICWTVSFLISLIPVKAVKGIVQ